MNTVLRSQLCGPGSSDGVTPDLSDRASRMADRRPWAVSAPSRVGARTPPERNVCVRPLGTSAPRPGEPLRSAESGWTRRASERRDERPSAETSVRAPRRASERRRHRNRPSRRRHQEFACVRPPRGGRHAHRSMWSMSTLRVDFRCGAAIAACVSSKPTSVRSSRAAAAPMSDATNEPRSGTPAAASPRMKSACGRLARYSGRFAGMRSSAMRAGE